jgi:hypothetical protein
VLDRKAPEAAWSAVSTVDAILKRAGVVMPRAPHRRRQPSGPPAVVANAPNDLWSID